jgi:hypothetical protein
MKSPSVSVPVQLSLLCEKGWYVVLCLVPDHAGILGNKAADTAAKEAAANEVWPCDHTVVTDIQSYFHSAMYLACQDVWTCTANSHLHAHDNSFQDVKPTVQMGQSSPH